MFFYIYIFILLMLFAQQAIAYTADCQSKLDQCKANLIKYANWGDGAYGSCAFSLSVQPNGEGGNAFVGTFEGGYIVGGVKQPSNTSCWFNCPSGQAVNEQGNCITCPSGQVPAASGQGCTFPPNPNPTPTANPNPTQTCTAPKVFVSISGNCETPVVCTPPKVRSENANICTDPPDACAIAKDACFDAVRGHPEMSCFANGSPLRVCMKSSLVDTVRCTPCGDGDSYSADAEGNPLNPSTSPSTSSDAPGLETRKTDCEGKGGKWDYVFDSTVSSSDTYREYWKCEIAGAVTSYGGNGAIIPNKGSTQSPTQDQNLNCGGTTGIACESTQLNSLNNLTDINKNIKDAFTLPSDAENCLVGTQCYKDKEKSILDNITKKLGDIPENLINLHTLVLSTYLVPFKDDKSAGTCNPASFIPITLSLTSIDGKVVSYVQPLPGDFLCRLFAIVRVFLVTGSLIVGFKLIVEAFVISS